MLLGFQLHVCELHYLWDLSITQVFCCASQAKGILGRREAWPVTLNDCPIRAKARGRSCSVGGVAPAHMQGAAGSRHLLAVQMSAVAKKGLLTNSQSP